MFGKGLTFDFFSDTLVHKAILVTPQYTDSIITSSSTHGKDTVLPRRTTWTTKILSATDHRLQQETMRVLTPLYKEIGDCFMGDGWKIQRCLLCVSATTGKVEPLLSWTICVCKLYSEPIDGLPEPTCRKLHVLFMTRWNVFHAPVHSTCFIMDNIFCHMQHDDAARKDIFLVMEAFSKVKDADGKMVYFQDHEE